MRGAVTEAFDRSVSLGLALVVVRTPAFGVARLGPS